MATTTRKTTTATKKKTTAPKATTKVATESISQPVEDIVEPIVETVEAETTVEDTEVAVEKKVFEKTTPIPCRSICTGVLYVQGDRSKNDYTFYDYDEIVDIEYQDLVTMIARRANTVTKPQFIVEDEDFIAQNSQLQDIYASMYTTKDLREIFKLSPAQMKKAIMDLPEGAKKAILGLASTMVETGQLDSIAKVKVIDEIFDTKLIFAVEEL